MIIFLFAAPRDHYVTGVNRLSKRKARSMESPQGIPQ
jgi:hypothetical protein